MVLSETVDVAVIVVLDGGVTLAAVVEDIGDVARDQSSTTDILEALGELVVRSAGRGSGGAGGSSNGGGGRHSVMWTRERGERGERE